jgi:ATP-dependent exoDNAse (exonuclease V) beta subunit
MTDLPDSGAREAIRSALDDTLVVEAAAGTGKTTALVQRVLALLRSGKTTLAALVAVTFTEKAAGELKLRLRKEIEVARRDPATPLDERARLEASLAELEEAHIGTIHGFCADLLRQRPVEARVDPLFEAADDDVQAKLFDDAFERWFQRSLADPPEGVRRVLRRRRAGRDASGPRDVLRAAGLALVNARELNAPWRRDDSFNRNGALDVIVAQLDQLAELAPRADREDDWLAKSLTEVARFASELTRREAIRGRDYDGLEEEVRGLARGLGANFWAWKGSGKLYAKGLPRTEVLARRDAVKAALDEVVSACDADLAACLQRDLAPLVREYTLLKTIAGKLDFIDLLVVARDLVRDNASVRQDLQRRFTHLLVDEFQDTDPLQAEILLLLCADDPDENNHDHVRVVPGKLFLVGDPKQAIYRFRGADVTLYETIKRRLVLEGAQLVHLTTSFRSAPSIQAAINAAFAPLMTGSDDGAQADYVALEPFRAEPDGRPTVVALPVPRPYADYGKVANYAVDRSTPDAVGAFVDWVVRASGWTIRDRGDTGPLVPIEPRHVCLLFRRFVNFGADVTRPYVRALEARRIPHVLVGGKSFHAREEVLGLRNALAAIEWPDDELSVFATLRGPLFAIGDDALLAFRQAHGSPHPLRRVDEAALDDLTGQVAEALTVLGRLHRGRNRRPIADTVAQLLEATRAHAGIAIWPTGEQALANVLRVLDQARRFEAGGATSFRAFVRRLEEDAERGAVAEAPVVEEGTDGVRIMTVHKAKGLEFPIVVLCDPTCATTQREPSRYVDSRANLWAMPLAGCIPSELLEHRDEILRHDAEEGVRLLYVAATRAREMLVVPVVGDEAVEGWVQGLHPALYPRLDERRASVPAPGCPAFGEDSVQARSPKTTAKPEASVRPGLHRPFTGTHGVVWWDPHVLDLDREEEAGLRQQRILSADDNDASERAEAAYSQWRARRDAAISMGNVPTLRVATVTDPLGDVAPAPAIDLRIEHTDVSRFGRPHGTRFGIFVHTLLATIDLAATDDAVARSAEAVGRMLGASADEIDAAAAAARSALAHPVLIAARAHGASCRREVPVLLRLDDGTLVEGVVDLAYREVTDGEQRWVVVELKTDVEMSSRQFEYERQVRLYAQAVAVAAGGRVRGVILAV